MWWIGSLFNLSLGLLAVAYLIRVERRYERCVDRIIAKIDTSLDSNLAQFDRARNEIRASMKAQTEPAITMLQETTDRFRTMAECIEQQLLVCPFFCYNP